MNFKKDKKQYYAQDDQEHSITTLEELGEFFKRPKFSCKVSDGKLYVYDNWKSNVPCATAPDTMASASVSWREILESKYPISFTDPQNHPLHNRTVRS